MDFHYIDLKSPDMPQLVSELQMLQQVKNTSGQGWVGWVVSRDVGEFNFLMSFSSITS